MSNINTLIKWKHHHFSSGSYIGDDFKKFSKDFKSYLKRTMETIGGSMLSYNKGHYYVSAFVQRSDGQIIYISLSDVRSGENSFNTILVRTASSPTDYTGGRNSYCHVEDLSSKISKL